MGIFTKKARRGKILAPTGVSPHDVLAFSNLFGALLEDGVQRVLTREDERKLREGTQLCPIPQTGQNKMCSSSTIIVIGTTLRNIENLPAVEALDVSTEAGAVGDDFGGDDLRGTAQVPKVALACRAH
ncbi:hypothetical protein B296_00001927 [Ensete ventricosum]|uniref:Uncharacterized protein n=1 Tax=Ensete ventricosum TaxID=4639 RepID=A0A427BC23_ENSVE|nr:hypothetical protein B296_00001927 [Ensete ventricosum]